MVLIRDAIEADLPEILDIYNDAIRNTVATFDLVEQSLEQRKLWFQKYGGKHPLIVAQSEGQVAGYCSLSTFREKDAYAKTTEISVYISEAHRGKGIASLLISEIIKRASLLGHHTIIAGITGGNEASVKLHKKFGFEFIGTFKEVGYKFDDWHDVHFYQLMLS
ncbi:N-acetyltransferase family protein [Brevibacillus ginsengisoli]|uniref:GNAT family N-acetyltransferase n=1 Tax=Brevibacillus ginsengisoli TaxID=363854 RepID=UPI003CF7DDF5